MNIEENQKFSEMLDNQKHALIRLLAASGKTDIEVGELVGVSRVMIHHWKRGDKIVPEKKLIKLAEVLNCEPSDIRYNTPTFKKSDLVFVVREVEERLQEINTILPPDKKAYLIASVFEQFQILKRLTGNDAARRDFARDLADAIDSFS